MMRDALGALALGALALLGCDGGRGPSDPSGRDDIEVLGIRLLREDAIHGAFHPNGSELMVDVLGPDGYYDVVSIDLAGTTIREYTADAAGIHPAP